MTQEIQADAATRAVSAAVDSLIAIEGPGSPQFMEESGDICAHVNSGILPIEARAKKILKLYKDAPSTASAPGRKPT